MWLSLSEKRREHDFKSYPKLRKFWKALHTLKFYSNFEIDDQSGEARTENELLEMHYEKLKQLQKGVFKYFRDDLHAFCLTNIATIDKRETLLKHLGDLSVERLSSITAYLNLVDASNNQYSKEFLIELIIWHMERRTSQMDNFNSTPLYPVDDELWDENSVPNDYKPQQLSDTCLSLPKLNLQYLTLHDYLFRNFSLFRLEAAYEIRQNIEEACVRMRPFYSFDEQTVAFGAWSRMAQPIVNFTIIEYKTCPIRSRE